MQPTRKRYSELSEDFKIYKNSKNDTKRCTLSNDPLLNVMIEAFSENEDFMRKIEKALESDISVQYLDEKLFSLIHELEPQQEDIGILIKTYGDQLEEFSAQKLFTIQDRWNLSDESLNQLFESCPHLKSIDLAGCQTLSLLTPLLKYSSCLTSIRLKDCTRISNFQELSKFSKLQVLDISGCDQFPTGCMNEILKKCPELSAITVDTCRNITDEDMVSIGKLRHLHSLSVWRCVLLTDSFLKELKNCKGLSEVDLWGCSNFSKTALVDLVQSLPNLQVLGLKDIPSVTVELIKDLRTINSRLKIDSFIQIIFDGTYRLMV